MKNIFILTLLLMVVLNSFAQDKTYEQMSREEGYSIMNVLKDEFRYDKSKASFRQTAKWIVEKMNIYTTYNYTKFYSSKEFSNTESSLTENIINSKVSIDSPYLIIEQDVKQELYVKKKIIDMNDLRDFNGTTTNRSFHRKIIIPINNLKAVEFSTRAPYYFEFKTFDESISGETIFKTERYSFYMTFDREDKIDERLMKAFVHLNRFFWKKVGKETF